MTTRWNSVSAWADAVFVGAAFAISLFFIGFNIHILCAVLLLLVLKVGKAIWRGYSSGLSMPRSLLAGSLVAYPLWLGLSLLWSPVPSISHATLWWALVGPLVFWGFVLERPKEDAWVRTSVLLLLAGLGLALVGIYQRAVLGDIPSGPFLDRNIYAALLSAIVFPLAGNFVAAKGRGFAIWPAFLAVAFFILIFSVALTQSRSAMITVALGVVVFTCLAWHGARATRLFALGLLTAVAFVAANMSWDGGLIDKLATLETPYETGHIRLLIWEGTWRMILDHPWTGVGLGIYPLLWPRYRAIQDTSGGYFAHNDYLQVWADVGLPGLLLFLVVLVAAFTLLVRQVRAVPRVDTARTELAGLAASLTALCANSVLNYNFSVVPSLIVFGMLLARLQMLDGAFVHPLTLKPSATLGQPAWRATIILLTLLPSFYFVSVAAASVITDVAVRKANEGQYESADAYFALAHRLWPSAESILMLRADMYRHLLAASESKDTNQRSEVFLAANDLLQRAEQLNPFRADIFLIRADLARTQTTLKFDAARRTAENDYRRALELDPWHFRARYRLATLLLEQGSADEARQVLEEGVSRSYAVGREDVIPYLVLTAKMRQQRADTANAMLLAQRAKEVADNRRLRRLRQAERGQLVPARLFSAP